MGLLFSASISSPPPPKMVECGAATGPEADGARARMAAAGYHVASCDLKLIHCNTQPGCEAFTWLENGFIQCFVTVDGRAARVMDYAPGQLLQPHRHDIDELFEIRGGSVLVSRWPDGPASRETLVLGAGDRIEIPKDMPHALCCDRDAGLQFHELVGTGEEAFQKRETTFLCAAPREYAMVVQ